jgi:hypothetical protein
MSLIQKNGNNLLYVSDHNGIKLESSSKRNYRKYSNTWSLDNTLLNKQGITGDIKG